MIEPLAHVAKGSVSRYTALASSSRNTAARKTWNNGFFTPTPRTPWTTDDLPLRSFTDFSPLELAVQCRVWSCWPNMHSRWCSGHSDTLEFDVTPNSRGRRSCSRYTRPRSATAHLSPPPNARLIASLFGQRNHATMPVSTTYSEGPATSTSPPNTSTDRWDAPSVRANFLKYSNNEMLLRKEPDEAFQAGHDLLSAGIADTIQDKDILGFATALTWTATAHWARDARTTLREDWISLVESLLSHVADSSPQRSALEAACCALKGESDEAAHAILLKRAALHPLGFSVAAVLYNAVLVSLARYKGRFAFLTFLRRAVVDYPCIPFAKGNYAPALGILAEVAEKLAGRVQLIEGIHPAVSLLVRVIFEAAESDTVVPAPWLKGVVIAVRGRQDNLHGLILSNLWGPTSAVFREFQVAKPRKASSEDREVQMYLEEDLLDLLQAQGDEAFVHQERVRIASLIGDRNRAEWHFARLCEVAQPDIVAIEDLFSLYVTTADIKALTRVFDKLFPDPSKWTGKLTLRHFWPAFLAISRSSRFQESALREWRERLARAGLKPDSKMYAKIMIHYAYHRSSSDVISVLQKIEDNGVKLESDVYQQGMTLCARHGDVAAAQALYGQSVKYGVEPDPSFIEQLNNSYPEAKSWEELLQVSESDESDNILNINTAHGYDRLLKSTDAADKAYDEIYERYEALIESGHIPDTQVYTTMAEVAAKADLFHDVDAIFRQMLKRNFTEPGFITPTIFSILLDMALRSGRVPNVLHYYNEMKNHMVPLTPAIHKLVLDGVSQWSDKKRRRLDGVLNEMGATIAQLYDSKDHIYLPMMDAALESENPGRIQEIVDEVTTLGHQPTLHMNIKLLAFHYQRQDLESVIELWPRILKEAGDLANASTTAQPQVTEAAAAIDWTAVVAGPFSSYIDALSRSGKHKSLARAFREYRHRGFKYTVRIWNRLIVVYMRAGHPDNAFKVADKFAREEKRRIARILYQDQRDAPANFTSWTATSLPLPTKAKAVTTGERWMLTKEAKVVLLSAYLQLQDGFNIRPTRPGEAQLLGLGKFRPIKTRVRIQAIYRTSKKAWQKATIFKEREQRRLQDPSLLVYRPWAARLYALKKIGSRKWRKQLRERERERLEHEATLGKEEEAGLPAPVKGR